MKDSSTQSGETVKCDMQHYHNSQAATPVQTKMVKWTVPQSVSAKAQLYNDPANPESFKNIGVSF